MADLPGTSNAGNRRRGSPSLTRGLHNEESGVQNNADGFEAMFAPNQESNDAVDIDDFALSGEAPNQDKYAVVDAESAAQSRKSALSVGKFNQWMLIDANRQTGIQVREEEAALRRRKEAVNIAYHEAREKKTAVGRGQQELTAGAVREYRGGLAKTGEAGRAELLHLRAIALRQKKEWAAHGARNAAIHGLEQKKRVLEARAEKFQTRRNAALNAKQEMERRRAAAKALAGQGARERFERLEVVRRSIPTVADVAAAREVFAKQKREAAAEVRNSVKDWEQERKRVASDQLQAATITRNVVVATRVEAAKNLKGVKEHRNKLAAEIRRACEEMEATRIEKIENAKQAIHEHHRQLYQRRYVDADAAIRVDESEYGTLVRATRNPDKVATSTLSAASTGDDKERNAEATTPPKSVWSAGRSGESSAKRGGRVYRPTSGPPALPPVNIDDVM